jgi:trimethylamine--corrinoid protein Co-methyltransferase
MKLNLLQVLSDDEVRRIHEASVHILETCGVKIHSPRMLTFLRDRGLPADEETHVVRFPRSCLEAALAAIPPQFDVFDREGQFAFTLGGGAARIAAGHNAVFWVDSASGQTRPSTIADVETFARLCQHLSEIHMIGVPVMPQDAPRPQATLLYGLAACVENSRKPVYFSTDNASVNRGCIELLRAAFAGDLTARPYGIAQLSSTSPLYWEEGVLDAFLDTVQAGVPLALLPEPNAGLSAPYTLAGLLTVHNAECLSGLVMAQLLRPGAKVMYGSSWTTTDMRSGAALVGSTETTICRIAGAQLARFYRTPSHTTAPNSDNHAHDEQNAWEKAFSMFAAVAAGNDLIVNCGMFATGMTCSHEQLLMDEEISAMSLRIARGLTVTEDTIARDLIESTGPQGEMYLTADHTLCWLHSEEHLAPRLSVRGPRAAWEAAGAKDTYQLARDAVAASADRPGAPLEAARRARLAEIIAEL